MVIKGLAKKYFAGLVLAAALGCAAKTPSAPPAPADSAGPGAPGPVRVSLLWSANVDLDLYVIDPTQETVYFGNPRSGSGGRIEHDVACGSLRAADPGRPWSEAVGWEHPPGGRYRVGVDFMDGCGSKTPEVALRVVVEAGGSGRNRRESSP